jgi:hypothetical protein
MIQRRCIRNKPRLYMKVKPCGCKFWAVLRPKRWDYLTRVAVMDTIQVATNWNRGRLLGATQCEHHTRELEQFK